MLEHFGPTVRADVPSLLREPLALPAVNNTAPLARGVPVKGLFVNRPHAQSAAEQAVEPSKHGSCCLL